MKLNLKKVLLIALILCGAFTSAQADGWKLTKTTVYGNGGYWENGQKSRIDCSYRGGIFSYERKTTVGKDMTVYSSRAVFTEPMKNYAPGENISVQIAFTHKGEKHGYTPYARVTVMPQNPQWTKGNGASNKIPATGTVDGQAIDASGHNTVSPPQTLTLTAKAPTSGTQMAIVYSCNGMDVVYLYDWEGQAIVSNQEYTQSLTPEPEQNIVEEEDINVQEKTEEYSYNESDYSEPSETSETEEYSNETYQEETETYEETETNTDNGGYDYEEEEDYDEETNYDEEEDYDEEEEGAFPLTKLLIVCGVAALLIALILILFRNKKKPAEAMAPNQESYQQPQQQPYQQPQQQPYQQPYYEQSPTQAPYAEQPAPQSSPAFCPNCGAPLKAGEKFCQECGQRIM